MIKYYCDSEIFPTLLAQLDHIVQTLDVDSHRQGDIVLPHSREESGEVNQPVYPLIHNYLLKYD